MDGILIIDKPYGMTSHDVVNWLRRKYKQKKIWTHRNIRS